MPSKPVVCLLLTSLAASGLCALAFGQALAPRPARSGYSMSLFLPANRDGQTAYEAALNDRALASELQRWHESLSDTPHVAGTPGDIETIEEIAGAFDEMGLEVETHWFWPYLSRPVSASVEITSPESVQLWVDEPALEADPYSAHPDLPIGYNAYSASGDVEAGVVYANYGRKEDFEKLAELGVSCEGKIVLARYGRNFRGFKAKYAEEARAAGLIIFTDPADSGFVRGRMYPEGGWAGERQIQRGSIKTLPYAGDPLTPGIEATQDAKRESERRVALPRIPVQPVAWASAGPILERMTGPEAPDEWQGGLGFPYRLTGGDDLRVRLRVEQERGLVRTANVIGTLVGSERPEEFIIVGCHHDSWGMGAGDPMAGMMNVMEAARCFTELASEGTRPKRSILFCAWGAEEHGIIGSVEWIEANLDMLRERCIAYINMDMASMGPLLRASAVPALRQLAIDAASVTPQARQPDRTALETWAERAPEAPGSRRPVVRGMGGGSDHVGFYFHAGVPCMSIGGGGAAGVSYHSNYDTLHWYRLIVGDDYEPALMVTRALNVALARLANADVLPMDIGEYAHDLRVITADLLERAERAGMRFDTGEYDKRLSWLEEAVEDFERELTDAIESGRMDDELMRAINDLVMERTESIWLIERGLPGRPWYKNIYMAPDQTSGYAAWPLPTARFHLENGNPNGVRHQLMVISTRVLNIQTRLRSAIKLLVEAE